LAKSEPEARFPVGDDQVDLTRLDNIRSRSATILPAGRTYDVANK